MPRKVLALPYVLLSYKAAFVNHKEELSRGLLPIHALSKQRYVGLYQFKIGSGTWPSEHAQSVVKVLVWKAPRNTKVCPNWVTAIFVYNAHNAQTLVRSTLRQFIEAGKEDMTWDLAAG